MTERKHFTFVALCALFILFYLRFILLRPYELPGESHFSDFYFTFFVWKQQSILIDKGFLPFGTFWLSNYVGGIPVSLVPFSGWEDPLNLAGTAIFRLTEDPVATLKILIFGVFSISAISSWVYGHQVTKHRDSSLIISIVYTFSTQHFADLHYGHLNLLAGFAFIPIALLFFEKLEENTNPRNALLLAASMILLYLTEWQCLFFTSMFLALRFAWIIGTRKSSVEARIRLLVYLAVSAIVFLFAVLPLFIPAYQYYGTNWSTESSSGVNPSSYFLRASSFPLGTDLPFNYMGITLLFLILVPILLRKRYDSESLNLERTYHFHLMAFVFFVFYSAAHYSPMDIVPIVYKLLPFASSIRVVGRSSVFVYLCTGVCASMGYLELEKYFAIRHGYRLNSLGRLFKKSLPILVCIIIFLDVTLGFEIRTTESFTPSSSSYDFIRQQPGEFRVMEIPQFWRLATITSNYLGHDVLDWRRPYLKGGGNFADAYNEFSNVGRNILLDNSHFEDELTSSWNVTYSRNSAKSIRQNPFANRFGLLISFNSSTCDDYVMLEQTLVEEPEITTDTHISLAMSTFSFQNASIELIIEIENERSQKSCLSYRMEYHNQGLFFSNLGVDANRENNAGQLEVRRNLYLDIPSSLNSSKVHARVIRISIKNQQRNGVENKIQIFLDWVAIYRAVDLHTKITMYGVRYILIHTEKESFGYLSKSVSVSAREEVLKIKSFLDIVGSFRQVHQDNGTYVYENMRYKGIVFAINAASTRHPLNIDFDSPPNASVSYSRPDPNTLVLGVTVGEPCRVVISQSYYRKWTVTEGNGKPAIDPLMGTCSIPLEQGTHVVTLHFQSYEESLALLPLFYIPLSLIVMSILTNRYGWRRYLKSRMAFVFLFYGLGLLSLFILSYFGLAGFQVDFDPIGQSLILVGFSIAGFAAFVWLPLRRWANLGLERTASRHWRQLLKFSSAAASAMKRPAAILSLSIASLLLVVIPLLMHRAIGGVWEYGVFRGYALYLTQLGKIAVSLNVLLMMTLTILFWPRDEGMLSVRTVLPISTLSSAAVSLRLATNQYVFMPLEPFRNELLFILLVTFLTTNLLILNMRYGSILVVRKGFAIEKMLPHSLIEALGILTIALAVLATIIQHFNGFISQLLGQGAFYTFLFVVLLHVATQTLQVSRERMT